MINSTQQPTRAGATSGRRAGASAGCRSDEAIERLNKLIVAPATRTIWGIPTEVEIGREEGLDTDSVLSLDNVTLIRKTLLIERMGALGSQKMVEVCAALVTATNCG